MAKLAIVGHVEPLWLETIQKVANLRKLANVPPPNENFWDFSINEMLWWQKMGKVVNRVKLAILSQSEPHFGGKDGKTCKMTKVGRFETI